MELFAKFQPKRLYSLESIGADRQTNKQTNPFLDLVDMWLVYSLFDVLIVNSQSVFTTKQLHPLIRATTYILQL